MRISNQAPPLHRLCASPDEAPHRRDFRGPRAPSTVEGTLPYRSRVIRPPLIHICFHDRLQGDLRRHVLKQVLGDSRPGHVPVAGGEPDGAGDVPVPGLGAERGAADARGLRGDGPERFRWPRAIPRLYSPEYLQAGCHDDNAYCQPQYVAYPLLRAPHVYAQQTHHVYANAPFSCPRRAAPSLRPHLASFHAGSLSFGLYITGIIRVAGHPGWVRGRLHQDRGRGRLLAVGLHSSKECYGVRCTQAEDVRVRGTVYVVDWGFFFLHCFHRLVC